MKQCFAAPFLVLIITKAIQSYPSEWDNVLQLSGMAPVFPLEIDPLWKSAKMILTTPLSTTSSYLLYPQYQLSILVHSKIRREKWLLYLSFWWLQQQYGSQQIKTVSKHFIIQKIVVDRTFLSSKFLSLFSFALFHTPFDLIEVGYDQQTGKIETRKMFKT